MKKWYLAILLIFALAALVYSSGTPAQRNFTFDYNLTLKDIPAGTSTVKIWVPYPTETLYQKVENTTEEVMLKNSVIVHDKKYNNKVLYYYIESPQDPSISINLSYKINRSEYINKPGVFSHATRPYEDSELAKYLVPSRLVTISPRIKEIAATITEGKESELDKARAIYDYVFKNVSYDKTIPGWGKGDTERVCDLKTGNCTDFHSLFISLTRASGIPSRFIIGTPIPKEKEGQVPGYHCWAEFYIEEIGWMPVDISEAWKDKAKYEYHFGAIDENRIELTRGRDIILEPAQNSEPLNYFLYPHVEIDGEIFENIDVIFKYK